MHYPIWQNTLNLLKLILDKTVWPHSVWGYMWAWAQSLVFQPDPIRSVSNKLDMGRDRLYPQSMGSVWNLTWSPLGIRVCGLGPTRPNLISYKQTWRALRPFIPTIHGLSLKSDPIQDHLYHQPTNPQLTNYSLPLHRSQHDPGPKALIETMKPQKNAWLAHFFL